MLLFGHLGRIFHQIFDNLLARIEGLEVVQRHALDGYFNYLFFGDAEGTLLAFEVELAGLYQHLLRHQADYLGTGNP